MQEKYKVIHESHARFLTSSEYRLLLSVNIHPGSVSIKRLSIDSGLDDNTIHRAKNTLFDRQLLWWTHESDVDAINEYTINKNLKLPHPEWKTRPVIDTRSFNGAPAWACWFLAVMNSKNGFIDCPRKNTIKNIAQYCMLNRDTVSKYLSILTLRMENESPVLDAHYQVNPKIIFNARRNPEKVVSLCMFPDRKKAT